MVTSNGTTYNLTNGDVLEGCDLVTGTFELRGVTATDITWLYTGGVGIGNPASLFINNPGPNSIICRYKEGGVSKEITGNFTVLGTPDDGDFTTSAVEGCEGTSITFNASADFDYQDIKFTVDGVSIPDGGSYTFNRDGNYSITMEGKTMAGCDFIVQKSDYINIIESFPISVTPTNNSSCTGTLTQNFTVSSPESDVNYTWDFGDGTTANGANVSHTFTSSNREDFTVSVTGEKVGCSTTEEIIIALNVASDLFDYSTPSSACATYDVTFTSNLSSAFDGETITWNFGDGTSQTETLPSTITHNYTSANTTVIASATFNGCTEDVSITIPDLLPNTINISGENQYCSAPYTTNLTANNISDLPSSFDYFWRTSDNQRIDNLSTANFTFTNFGTSYFIELVATKNGEECVLDNFTVRARRINATIYSSNGDQGCVTFNSDLSFDLRVFGNTIDLADVVSTNWTITKDGNPFATSTNLIYNFNTTQHGDYHFELEVETVDGCTATEEYDIEVGLEITPDFTVDSPLICNQTTNTFTNTTDLAALGINRNEVIYEWQYVAGGGWTVSNDANGNGSNFYENIQTLGTVDVSLRATYKGCTSSPVVMKQFDIEGPYAEFEFNLTDNCDPNSLEIINNSLNADAPFEWQVNVDGNTYNFTTASTATFNLVDEIPVTNLSTDIDYTITLTAKNTAGCEDIYDNTYRINANPAADITWNGTSSVGICANETKIFNPGSGIVNSDGTFTWSLTRNGTELTTAEYALIGFDKYTFEPNASFIDDGTYTVSVEIIFADGCSDTDTKGPINVYSFDITQEVQGEDHFCYDGTTTDDAIYTVTTNISNLSAYTWEWTIVGNGTTFYTISGDENNLQESITYNFTELLNDQNNNYTVNFKMISDACEKESSKTVKVTMPEIDLNDATTTYASYNFLCDEVETYIDPKLDRGKVFKPTNNKTTYQWFKVEGSGETEITTFTENRGGNNVIFKFSDLDPGLQTLRLLVTDTYGCTGTDNIEITVPELPIGIADFSSSAQELACRGSISFLDYANGKDGNSLPRFDVNGDTIEIESWTWHITRDVTLNEFYTKDTGNFDYFFDAGEYTVQLSVEDEQGCTYTSEILNIKVGGVRGELAISRKAGYAPFNVDFEGTPSYISDDVDPTLIDYIWFSGDGYSETSSENFSFTYLTTSLGDRDALPALIFRDNNGCEYPANSSERIQILTEPNRTVGDITRCITDGDTTLIVSDDTFTPANIDETNYSYTAITKYQWYVDDAIIPSADNGDLDNATFTYGTTDTPFTINPDDTDGKTYIIKSWLEATYTDKLDGSKSFVEEVAFDSDTFTVVFDPQPIADFTSNTPVCLSDSLILDASTSDFGSYSRGTITFYHWVIPSVKDTITTTPNLSLKFATEGTYNVTLTVESNNSCASNTINKDIIIKPLPIVDFNAPSVCLGEESIFENTSTFEGSTITSDPSIINSVAWYFDYDENIPQTPNSTDISPTFEFTEDGLHKIKLEVYTLEGCVDSVIKDIEIYELPTITPDEDQYICEGESIDLSVLGGTSFTWSTGETTRSITVTPTSDSTFYVDVLNNFGCLSKDSVTIFVIPEFEQTSTFEEACEGDTITLTANIAAYENTQEVIEWSTGETSETIKVTTSGIYNVTNTVTHLDGKICIFTKTVNVEFHANPGEIEKDTVYCFDNGPITLAAPTNPNFSYLWEDTGETTSTVQRTSAGIYTVTVTDNTYPTNCATTSSIEVIAPSSIASFTSNEVCFGDTTIFDAAASTVDYGGLEVEYHWELGTHKDTVTITPSLKYAFPEDGNHDVALTVVPVNGCPSPTINQNVIVNELPVVNFSAGDVCFNETVVFNNLTTYLGSTITASNTNITAINWDFDYDGSTPNWSSNELSPTHVYADSGTYNVLLEIITDKGCSQQIEKSVTIFELPTPIISEDLYICEGENTNLEIMGGVAYLWENTSETTSTINVSPIADETYVVKVINEHGCISYDSVTVFVIPKIKTTQLVYEVCEGTEVILDARIGEYDNVTENYQWSTNESSATITVAEPGTYSVTNTVEHESGKTCTFQQEYQVIHRPNPAGFVSSDTVFCFSSGPIRLDATVGSNFSYYWEDTGETTQSVQRNKGGFYTVTITDNTYPTQCATTTTIEVIAPTTTANFIANEVCLNETSILDASSSAIDYDGLDVEYYWNLGSFGDTTTTSSTLNYIFPTDGNHTVELTVTPVGGCSSEVFTNTVLVHQLPQVRFSTENICITDIAVFDNLSSYLGNEIQSNANQISSIKWDFDYNGTTPNWTNEEVSPSYQYKASGTYRVLLEVTSEKGCPVQFESQITIYDTPTPILTEDLYICEGEQTTLKIEGGIAYLWENTKETTPEITVSPIEDETYIVKVINETGCISYDSVTVFVIPQIKTEQLVYEVCEGTDVLLDARVSNYDNILENYIWSTNENTSTITVSTPGIYSVINTVEHESGKICTFEQEYEVIHRPIPNGFAVTDTVICFETEFEITLAAPEGNNFVYYWEDTGETTASVIREEEGEYTVTIIDTTNPTDCEITTSVFVDDICPPRVFTPTAMTPNGDGLNEEFLIRSKYALDIKLNIYNRWGEIIFNRVYTNSDDARKEGNGWNGMHKGKIVPGGVYSVIVEYISELDGKHHRQANHITVIN